MIKAILFDVGGTLIVPHPSVGGIYAEMAEKFGHQIDDQTLNKRFKAVWKTHQNKLPPSNKDDWKLIVNEVFRPFSVGNFEPFFNAVYQEFEQPHRWHIFDDVRPTLKEIKKHDIRLGVASNWDDRLPSLLKSLNLYDYFDYHFISFQMGVSKPSKQFFDSILVQLNLSASSVLHIGDDLIQDKWGAEQVGIKFMHADRSKKDFNLIQTLGFLKNSGI